MDLQVGRRVNPGVKRSRVLGLSAFYQCADERGSDLQMKRVRKHREKGQSAVEMALTLPLLLLLIFGMIEMGWMASTRLVMDNMTREGARAGIVAQSMSGVTTEVTNSINGIKPSYMTSPLTITVTFSNPSDYRNGDVTVTVNYNLPTLTPLTAIFTSDGTFHLHSTCTMKMS